MADVHELNVMTGERTTRDYTQAEKDAIAASKPSLEEMLARLRSKRNAFLVETDWIGLVDTALTSEESAKFKLYRQALRDLPSGLDTEEKVKNVTWPTNPE